jgi:hypothetical protein
MNSKQLGHHVCKAVTGLDLSALPMDGRQELCDAINLTLAEWLQMLPQERRITTFGAATSAAIVQEINIVSGAKAFLYVAGLPYPAGGFASEENAIGSTALVEGAVGRNQLQAPGELLMPYLGSTNPSARLTLYGDALHLPASTWTVEGEVKLITSERDSGRPLLYHPGRATMTNEPFTSSPKEWWLEPIAPMQEEESRKFVLRVWPLPDGPYALRIPVGHFPHAFQIEDFFEKRSVSFSPIEASLFVAMAKGSFLDSSSHVSPKTNLQGLSNAAAAARIQMRNIQRPLSTQPEFLGTPYGY